MNKFTFGSFLISKSKSHHLWRNENQY